MVRQSRARAETGFFVLLVFVGLILANFLAVKVLTRFRFDLTKRGLYSLSQGTKRTLGRLTDQLTITVYWTPDQPPPANDERTLREQLEEYAAAGNGNVTVRVVHTDNDQRRQDAAAAGCQQRPLQVVDVQAQQANAFNAYRCITFGYLRHTEKIEFLNPGIEGMEYQITSIIKKMIDPERRIGFLTGHDEPTIEQALPYLSRILQDAHLGYTTTPVDLHGGDEDVPNDIKGLVIMGPTRRIEERELRRINAYLMRGGSVAIFASGVNVTGTDVRPTAANAEHNLNALLEGYGMTLNQELILDPRSADAIEQFDEGRVRIRMFSFPVLAQEGIDQSHPSVFRLPGIITPFVSSLSVNRERATANGTRLTIVGRTSSSSTAQRGTFDLDAIELIQRRGSVFARGGGPYTVAVALEGQLRSAFTGEAPAPAADAGAPPANNGPTNVPAMAAREHPARLLVVGSSRVFHIDQLRAIAPLQQGMPTNVEMLLNTFDWLSQDPDLLAVRAKDVSEPELSGDVSDTKKNAFKWGSIIGLPLLVGVIGVVLSRARAARRLAYKL